MQRFRGKMNIEYRFKTDEYIEDQSDKIGVVQATRFLTTPPQSNSNLEKPMLLQYPGRPAFNLNSASVIILES